MSRVLHIEEMIANDSLSHRELVTETFRNHGVRLKCQKCNNKCRKGSEANWKQVHGVNFKCREISFKFLLVFF